MATIGTTTLSFGLSGVASSRNAVYSSISGVGLWYAAYNDGTGNGWVLATSPDATTWTAKGSIVGMNVALSAAYQCGMATDTAGNVYFAAYNSSSGDAQLQVWNGTAWLAAAVNIEQDFQGSSLHYYAGTTNYLRMIDPYAATHWQILRISNPGPTSTAVVEDYQVATTAGNSTGAIVAETMGTNLVTAVVTTASPPALDYAVVAADTVPGSVQFPAATSVLGNANLAPQIAAATDGSGVLHLVFHIVGTGWFDATYNGASWTVPGLVAGNAIPGTGDNDAFPAMVADPHGNLHLHMCRYNAASDYGISHIQYSAGAWAAQADTVPHDGVNRSSLAVSRTFNGSSTLLTWQEGTTSPYNVVATLAADDANIFTAGTVAAATCTTTTITLAAVAPTGGTTPYAYQWYRGTYSDFLPAASAVPGGGAALVGQTGLTCTDTPPLANTPYYYRLIATDSSTPTAQTARYTQRAGALLLPALNIAFIGDSITTITQSGDSVTDPSQVACDYLAKRRGGNRAVSRIVGTNSYGGMRTQDWLPAAGVPSGDTQNMYANFKATVGATPLALICVELGTNDAGAATEPYLDVNLQQYQTNMQTIVAQLNADFPGVPILLNSPIWNAGGNDLMNRYLQAYQGALASLTGVGLHIGDTDGYVYFLNNGGELFDGTHPDAGAGPGAVSGIQDLGKFWGAAIDAALFPPPVRRVGLNGGI